MSQTQLNARKYNNALIWQDGKYIRADGILSEVISNKGGVFRVKVVGSTEESYLVTDGERWSHGATLQQAREDLIFKLVDQDTSKYEGLSLDHSFTVAEAVAAYRTITGACSLGVQNFFQRKGVDRDSSYTVREIIKMTKGEYGSDVFAGFFNAG